MKARKVKKLDPAGPLADNMERIVRVRLAELCDFMPRAAEPGRIEALHDMRIAAKRLRYILEIAHPCFGEYAKVSVKLAKELQDVLGEIHDCDVHAEDVEEFREELVRADVRALAQAHHGRPDLERAALRRAPNRKAYAGVAAIDVFLRARRELLFGRFLELWTDLERNGFRARLEFAVGERPTPPPVAADERAAAADGERVTAGDDERVTAGDDERLTAADDERLAAADDERLAAADDESSAAGDDGQPDVARAEARPGEEAVMNAPETPSRAPAGDGV